MRRSRIKAVATVPARRKPNRDVKEEVPDLSNIVSNEEDKKPIIEIVAHCIDDSKQTLIKTTMLPTENHDANIKLQQSSSISHTLDTPIVPNNTETVAMISNEPEFTIIENFNQQKEVSVTASKQSEIIAKEDDQCKRTLGHENTPTLDETKASPNLDTSQFTKVSQTRTSFMRPTPRLDGGGRIRRNSVQGSGASASESEDDSRRTTNAMPKRVRNDSFSSLQNPKTRENCIASIPANSAVTNGVCNAGSGATSGKNFTAYSSRQKRKMIVSESARKLAEARRDFLLKYEHKQPDRAKLTMYDLIYYNPVTNPMKKPDGSLMATQRPSSSVVTPKTEEDEDEDCEMSEAMPVPQVKVGPDGHLVIDEQSLVIEHTGAKKNRQALARTEALVDEESNGNGFYKKRQKTKDWSKWETLKFYKALNTVGTDFLLMQSLFPTRSRQEIKMKFKKEERTNHRFIEKALTYHQEFDIDSLKEDLATFEATENKETDSAKSEKSSARQGSGPKRKKNKSRRMVATSIDELNETNEPDSAIEKSMDAECHETTAKGEKKRIGQRRGADTRLRAESTGSSNESASDTEIYQIKPTRSGRKPKVRKLQAPTINTLDNLFSDHEQEAKQTSPELPLTDNEDEDLVQNLTNEEELVDETVRGEKEIVLSERSQNIHNSVSGIAQVEPGSLVIVSRESTDEPGETVLQVYMVSSDIDDPSGSKQNMTPVVLTPELLNTVTAGITKVAPIDVNPD